jgi:peptide/nickel transport system substrate-binding protein
MDEGNAVAAMKRRRFLVGAAAALAAPMIGRAWAAAQVLKFIPAADLTILDPIWTTDYRTRNHAFAVFDTLYGALLQTSPPSVRMGSARGREQGHVGLQGASLRA